MGNVRSVLDDADSLDFPNVWFGRLTTGQPWPLTSGGNYATKLHNYSRAVSAQVQGGRAYKLIRRFTIDRVSRFIQQKKKRENVERAQNATQSGDGRPDSCKMQQRSPRQTQRGRLPRSHIVATWKPHQ